MPLRQVGIVAALLGIALCAWFAASDMTAFWRAYLTAFVAWQTVPLGCLALLLIWQLTGGAWGRLLGPALAAGARTMPLIALLGLPFLLELGALFPWTHSDALAPYLDEPFFIVRTLVYLMVWTVLALLLSGRRRRALAAAGAILFALTASFAAIDWSMSLDSEFSSSLFGMVAIGGHLAAGLAFATLVTLARADHDADALGLGRLLLGAVLLWTYLVFIQYLVLWSGDMPHDAAWILARTTGGWRLLLAVIILGHLALPAALLLSGHLRRNRRVVAALAGLVLLCHLLHQVWQTAPAWGSAAPAPLLLAAALLAFGGLWLVMASLNLASREPLPHPQESGVG